MSRVLERAAGVLSRLATVACACSPVGDVDEVRLVAFEASLGSDVRNDPSPGHGARTAQLYLGGFCLAGIRRHPTATDPASVRRDSWEI